MAAAAYEDVIDLHGIRHKQALELVQDALDWHKDQGSFSLTIITGNSSVLQQRIFKEILEFTDFKYYIPAWSKMLEEIKNMKINIRAPNSNINLKVFSLKKHLDEIINLKKEKTESTQRGYIQMALAIEKFCEDKGYNYAMDLNSVNLQFVDKFRCGS